jgi:hypothetical protein
MNRCDKCEMMARFTVAGSNLNSYAVSRLCALHAWQLCDTLGDKAGAAKFAALVEGDKVSA